jgi:hypothetical protein
LQYVASGRTDDRGEYRIAGIPPGTYYIRAGAQSRAVDGSLLANEEDLAAAAGVNKAVENYPGMYFPDALTLRQAQSVEFESGAEKTVHLRVTRQQAYRVRGRLVDPYSMLPPRDVGVTVTQGASTTLVRRGSGGAYAFHSSFNKDTGALEILGFLPGTYDIRVGVPGIRSGCPGRSATRSVTVVNSDLDDVAWTLEAPQPTPPPAPPRGGRADPRVVPINPGPQRPIDNCMPSPADATATAPATTSAKEPAKGSLSGVVTGTAREPLPDTRVTLIPSKRTPDSPIQAHTITADSAGRFQFSDLPGGRYELVFGRNGFVRQRYGQRVAGGGGALIDVADGQLTQDVVMSMTPTATVTGHVRNSNQQAMERVPVQLLRFTYDADGNRTLGAAGHAVTDDRGEFRIYFVTPGHYYLSAGMELLAARETADEQWTTSREYSPVFFPNAPDLAGAILLDVQAGATMDGLDLTLVTGRRAISGNAVTPSGRPISATVTLRPSDNARRPETERRVETGPGGAFTFRDVPPGTYRLTAENSEMRGAVSITVGREDIRDAAIPMAQRLSSRAIRIRGTLVVDGPIAPKLNPDDCECPTVRLTPVGDEIDGSLEASYVSNGTFTLEVFRPGTYRLSANRLPAGFYLKEARFGPVDVLNRPFEINGSEPGLLTMVISRKAGALQGTVIAAGHVKPSSAVVALIPEQYMVSGEMSNVIQTTEADDDGRFAFTGIAPGNYRIFAWEALEAYTYFDPEVLRAGLPNSQPTRIEESSEEMATVQVIPAPAWPR